LETRYVVNDVQSLLAAAESPGVWGFDLETWQPGAKPDPWHPQRHTLTAALARDNVVYGFMLDHPLDTDTTDDEYDARVQAIDQVVMNADNTIVCHNLATFDAIWWTVLLDNDSFAAQQFDTRIAHSLIDENAENSLDALATKYTTYIKNEEQLNRKRLHTADPQAVLRYNMSDALISLALYEPILADLVRENQLVLFEFMREVSRITQEMTLCGAHVDTDWVKKHVEEIEIEAATRQKDLELMFGDVSVTSTKQLGEFLYGKLHLPVLVRSKKTGVPAVSKEAFLMLKNKGRIGKDMIKILDEILDFRATKKLVGTYLQPFLKTHTKSDGRLHTTFNIGKGLGIGGAVTGRLSSANPNLQNMPRDPRLRGVVVPTTGMAMFDADYSQLELRILAWYAQDPIMLEAFASGQDLHTLTMAKIAGLEYAKAVALLEAPETKYQYKEKRVQAKRTNFGIPYGIGPFKLMQQIWESGAHATEGTAQELLEYWKRTFRSANDQLERWKDEVIKTGRIVTPTGRVRHLLGGSRYTAGGGRVLRQGINFPIQSLAADITFVALYLLHREFSNQGGARLILTVHDSIMGEYYAEDWPDMEQTLERIMVHDTLAFLEERWNVTGIPLEIDIDTNLQRWGT
jgi:DNA polymerase-1